MSEIVPYKINITSTRRYYRRSAKTLSMYKQRKILSILYFRLIFFNSLGDLINESHYGLGRMFNILEGSSVFIDKSHDNTIFKNIGNVIKKAIVRYFRRKWVRNLKSLLPTDILKKIGEFF
jgi:hypothetical protein